MGVGTPPLGSFHVAKRICKKCLSTIDFLVFSASLRDISHMMKEATLKEKHISRMVTKPKKINHYLQIGLMSVQKEMKDIQA